MTNKGDNMSVKVLLAEAAYLEKVIAERAAYDAYHYSQSFPSRIHASEASRSVGGARSAFIALYHNENP